MNIKLTTVLVPAALFVSGIALHSFFDPAAMLSRKQKTLQQTPVMIESIRGIGQLITAEYSGEVIASLQDEEIRRMSMHPADSLNEDTVARKRLHTNAVEKLKSSRAFKKRQLIAVGRGRVRAGIDFSHFTEKNIRYLPEKKRIYLYGLTPEILYCDINPWFISEKKIPGFEIVAATKQANNTPDLLLVKQGCLRRLRERAVSNGITRHAKTSAEELLRVYFSILTGTQIEMVNIEPRKISSD